RAGGGCVERENVEAHSRPLREAVSGSVAKIPYYHLGEGDFANADLFQVYPINVDVSPQFAPRVFFKVFQLSLASVPQLVGGAPECECEDADAYGSDRAHRHAVVVKEFRDMPEDDKRKVIGGAIFVTG